MNVAVTFFTWPMVLLPAGDSSDAILNQDWTVSACGLDIRLPRGTATDGASIPRFLWRLCGHPLESPRVYAALVHDYLYSGGVPGVSRELADRVYRELLVRYGWGRVRAWAEYLALRAFGASHWRGSSETNEKKGETK